MEKGKKYTAAGIVVLLGIVVTFLAMKGSGSTANNGVIDGTYEMIVESQDAFGTARFQMKFDAASMTYEQLVIREEGTYTLDSGSYSQGEGEVMVFSETSDENTKTYEIKGDIISSAGFVYEGENLPSNYEKAD